MQGSKNDARSLGAAIFGDIDLEDRRRTKRLVEVFEQICAGETLTAVTRIADLKARESGKLGKMLIVTSETSFTNADGKLAAVQRSQVIFY